MLDNKLMKINVNGIEVDVKYSQACIDKVLLPLIEQLKNIQKQKNRKIIVYLAAAPGCGKSTLALYLETLCNDIQALSMDGFHHTNKYLNTHYRNDGTLLACHKGAIDTFDVDNLIKHIKDIKGNKEVSWPIYDRNIHDPIDNAIKVEKDIILIEGNYLLLDIKPWDKLIDYCDHSIFIKGEVIDLENRLVSRKMKSVSLDKALIHYHETDKPNILLVNKHSIKADLKLKLDLKEEVNLIQVS